MNIIPKPKSIISLGKYKIKIVYSDGLEGILDISNLANKGIFKAWEEGDLFDKVFINHETYAIAWSEDIEICPNKAYTEIQKKNLAINT